MLALDRLGKTYPNGVHALERFSAEIGRGDIAAIIGGSGCGKSTLLRAIAGLDRATSGTVTLDDISISAPHAKIGIIFQEPRLLPWLSVAGNIGFGLSDLPANIRREKVAVALARVGLSDKADARPRDRQSPHFDNFKRRVLTALDRSLDRKLADADSKSTTGEAMWW